MVSSFLTYASNRHTKCIYWDSCEYIEPFLFNLFILQYSHGNFEKKTVYTFHYLYKIIQIKRHSLLLTGLIAIIYNMPMNFNKEFIENPISFFTLICHNYHHRKVMYIFSVPFIALICNGYLLILANCCPITLPLSLLFFFNVCSTLPIRSMALYPLTSPSVPSQHGFHPKHHSLNFKI